MKKMRIIILIILFLSANPLLEALGSGRNRTRFERRPFKRAICSKKTSQRAKRDAQERKDMQREDEQVKKQTENAE